MTSQSTNPYRPYVADEASRAPRKRLPRLLLMLLSLILLYRGLLMAYSFAHLYVLQDIPIGIFEQSLMLKDGVYGLTALLGSSLIAVCSRAGWLFAVAHWLWYIAFEVIIVLCAEAFSWVFPPRFDPPQWIVQVTMVFAFAVLGLARG